MDGFAAHNDADGVLTVTMDMPGQTVNTMNGAYVNYMAETLARLAADVSDGSVKGVILTSAKKTFFAGGDIDSIIRYQKERAWDDCMRAIQTMKAQLSQWESCGVPVAAAINGAALGGGLEICLACHYRVALDLPQVQVGFPEVSLGLLPAAGGIVRLVRMLGLKRALPLLMEGTRLSAAQAKEAGVIDELGADLEDLMAKARAWVLAHAGFQQPWARRGFTIPGGAALSVENAGWLAMAPAMLRKKTRGLLPAPEAILAAAVEGSVAGFQAALSIESRHFETLIRSRESAALIASVYTQLNEITAKAGRPAAVPVRAVKRVGILGAGMMGRGIAYACAMAGLAVVLKDVSLEQARAAKDYSAKLLDKQVQQRRMTHEKRDATLALIEPTVDAAALGECDIIIEAVFEDLDLKRKLTQELAAVMREDQLFASNTSTLPISQLALAHPHPERFIGLHFFSPVDKMNLVEIIKGRCTSEVTVAHAYDFVQSIRKTPIVVADGRGFYTSRVFGSYCDEGIRMLEEGVNPALIENLAKQSGMPVGPLAVMDEVEISLMAKAAVTNKRLDEVLGDDFCSVHQRMNSRALSMVAESRTGRAGGKGFYDYAADGSKRLSPIWAERFGRVEMPLEDIKDRMMFRQCVETLHCLQRGVLSSARDANIGSLYGWGFPVHTGGTLQYIEGYGHEAFARRSAALAAKYGNRFVLPGAFEALLERAA